MINAPCTLALPVCARCTEQADKFQSDACIRWKSTSRAINCTQVTPTRKCRSSNAQISFKNNDCRKVIVFQVCNVTKKATNNSKKEDLSPRLNLMTAGRRRRPSDSETASDYLESYNTINTSVLLLHDHCARTENPSSSVRQVVKIVQHVM